MRTIEYGNVAARRAGWIALLSGATAVGSFIFACATPFPALATLAALHMRRRDAFALTASNWLANQIIGYGFLHYPRTWDSFAWGAAIGIAALVATACAVGTESIARRAGWTAAAVSAFVVSILAYEATLFAATSYLPSDASAFGARVVLYIVAVNGVAFLCLLLLQGLGRAAGLAVSRPGAERNRTLVVGI